MSGKVLRILAILLGVAPMGTAAGQVTAVAGVVTDDRSIPVNGARVTVQGAARTVTTDARGRFRIEGVSGESVVLVVTMVGFRPVTLTARAGAEDVMVRMSPSVFALSEVVITGTVGGEEKKAIGNSVARVAAAEINAIAPSADLSQLLNGRARNVVFQAQSGAVGSGGKIRVRGVGSLALANEPILYIDGVRADNSVAFNGGFSSTSRINDIDPASIESIEIIKGPAAATLYGTEASNGVIQVITKKGAQGRADVGFEIGQGANWMWNPEKAFEKTRSYYRVDGQIRTLNLVKQESDSGRPIFQTGRTQRYAMEVRGGSQALQYSFSGTHEDQNGAMDPNRHLKWTGRANFQSAVTDKLTIAVNGGFISSRTNIPYFELFRGVYSPSPPHLNTPRRGFSSLPPEVARIAVQQAEDVTRFTGGVQVSHAPTKWFNHRLNVGVDDVNEAESSLSPFLTGFAATLITGAAAQGSAAISKREQTTTTVDYSATVSANLTSALGSKTSLGGQYFRKSTLFAALSGTGFPAPGVTNISSAAQRTSTGSSIENKTAGVYVQQQFSLKDRLFLTGAVRADDNSAFGSEFNLVTYPKVMAAWVVSEEPFWPKNVLSTFRLRGAYGQSGLQPNQFSALRSYQAVTGPGGVPAVRPSTLGNPDLGPERGVEIEMGFEAGLFGDRVGLDFTFFNKRTTDAILARPVAPSTGFGLVTQFVNIGEVRNRGFEAQLTATPISRRNLKVDLAFDISHTDNRIVDIGGAGNIAGAGANQEHREGFPIGGHFFKRVVSAELSATGQVINVMCDAGINNGFPGGEIVPCASAPAIYGGQPLPKFEGSFNTTIQVGQRLTLSSLLDFKTGGRSFSADVAIQCSISRRCEANVDPASDLLAAADMVVNTFGAVPTPEVRYIKFRSLSASYRMPDQWARALRAKSAFLTLTARNLHTWTGYKLGPDPEVGQAYNAQHASQAFQAAPIPFQFFAQLRLSF
jgi:TonB-linked SusC/RagA family outer membrane protein